MAAEKKDSGKEDIRRNPYEVLGISCNSTDQEIKSAYKKLALRYHPDKNPNDPLAADIFKEITFAYEVLSDPEARRQYDTPGFEAVGSENQDLELDLSSLGAVNTVFAALFSKLGVPIRTTVSANLLDEALNGTVTTLPLMVGHVVSRKVEKQCAHFYSVTLTEEQSRGGLICQARSSAKSKFKLLYFDREENGGLSLALQEESRKKGNISSAAMYFFGFPVYRFDHRVNSRALARDPETGFFKRLDGFQPCEINELKAGSHVFAVYGDNFFRSVSYTLEVFSAAPYSKEKEYLRSTETQIVSKRAELSKFESEYHEVFAQFSEMTNRYAGEIREIDQLLKRRREVQAAYTIAEPLRQDSKKNKKNKKKNKKGLFMKYKEESEEVTVTNAGTIDGPKKKKWYNLRSKNDKRKPSSI